MKKTLFLLVFSAMFCSEALAGMSGTDLDALQMRLVQAESSWKPLAVGDGGKARGLGQIQRATWERLSKRPWADAFDAEANLQVMRILLEEIADQYGERATPALVAVTYNSGRYYKRIPAWAKKHRNKIYRAIVNGKNADNPKA